MPNDPSKLASLADLADELTRAGLAFELPGATTARDLRDELANQITDYLVPRLQRIDAPLLAVLGGSTGSGKSTITNSLAGAEVSPAGVLRPTTRAPVLICHPDDADWFSEPHMLPDLARTKGSGPAEGPTLKIESVASLLPGLAMIDAPDIDSVEEANRELATQLLAAADLWIFVTTAIRYADAVPWEFLGRARSRGTALAVVINRVPDGAESEIVPHLREMLVDGGLPDVQLFTIPQTELTDGRIPTAAIAELEQMLQKLAEDAEHRAEVIRQTIDGALASVPDRARVVVAASSAQDAAVDGLRIAMEASYQEAKDRIAHDLSAGTLLRGEVLDRWQELIGTSEMMRAVQRRITTVRDRISGFVRTRSGSTSEVQGEITSALERLLLDHADAAALEVTTQWSQLPGGTLVIGSDQTLQRASDDLRSSVGGEIRAWQDDLLELVRERGAGKRTMARAMAFGVNSIGVALMIVLFAQTGGVTGGEIVVASGTATLAQGLLNAIFGERAVTELAEEAAKKLLVRIDTMIDLDANRFRTALWKVASPPEVTSQLTTAVSTFEGSE